MIKANNIEDIMTNNPNLNFKILVINNHFKIRTTNVSAQCVEPNLLIFCKSDKGYFKIGEQNYKISANRIIVIPSNIVHRAYHNPKDYISVVIIRFLPQPNSKLFGSKPFVFDLPQTTAFWSIIENMVNFALNHNIHEVTNNIIASNLLKAVFWNIVAVLKSGLSNDITINKAIAYIEKNLHQYKYVTVEELLSHVNLNHCEFTNRFKQATGITFKRYLFEKKMQIAKQLLLMGEYSIDQIAYILTYSDRYIFSNQFKRCFGVSPAKMRREARSSQATC